MDSELLGLEHWLTHTGRTAETHLHNKELQARPSGMTLQVHQKQSNWKASNLFVLAKCEGKEGVGDVGATEAIARRVRFVGFHQEIKDKDAKILDMRQDDSLRVVSKPVDA